MRYLCSGILGQHIKNDIRKILRYDKDEGDNIMKHFDPTLYFITDSQNIIGDETLEGLDVFLEIAEKAILGGASIIQLREKAEAQEIFWKLQKHYTK